MMVEDTFAERVARARRDGAPKPIVWVKGAAVPDEAIPLIDGAYRVGEQQVIVEDSDPVAHWYVLHTTPQADRQAGKGLGDIGYKTYAPRLKQWRVVKRPRKGFPKKVAIERPLFPGYLFLGLTHAQHANWPAIEAVDGVQGVLRREGMPQPVLDVAQLSSIMDAEQAGEFDETREQPARPKPQRGTKVEVTEGPFKGLAGIVYATPGERVKILLGMLGRVDVGLDQVQSA